VFEISVYYRVGSQILTHVQEGNSTVSQLYCVYVPVH
jgi:hypothetical protein